jgi:hypothetical protein
MSVHWALLPISFQIPRREPPNRAPAKKDTPFSETSSDLLNFPVNGLPRFPNWSLRRKASISRAFFYTFPSKSMVNEHPIYVPQQGPYGERSFISRANGLFVLSFTHLYLSELLLSLLNLRQFIAALSTMADFSKKRYDITINTEIGSLS